MPDGGPWAAGAVRRGWLVPVVRSRLRSSKKRRRRRTVWPSRGARGSRPGRTAGVPGAGLEGLGPECRARRVVQGQTRHRTLGRGGRKDSARAFWRPWSDVEGTARGAGRTGGLHGVRGWGPGPGHWPGASRGQRVPGEEADLLGAAARRRRSGGRGEAKATQVWGGRPNHGHRREGRGRGFGERGRVRQMASRAGPSARASVRR